VVLFPSLFYFSQLTISLVSSSLHPAGWESKRTLTEGALYITSVKGRVVTTRSEVFNQNNNSALVTIKAKLELLDSWMLDIIAVVSAMNDVLIRNRIRFDLDQVPGRFGRSRMMQVDYDLDVSSHNDTIRKVFEDEKSLTTPQVLLLCPLAIFTSPTRCRHLLGLLNRCRSLVGRTFRYDESQIVLRYRLHDDVSVAWFFNYLCCLKCQFDCCADDVDRESALLAMA
jgi:hypothetical protein